MNRHLLIVANTFRAAGLVLGVPSLLLCLWLTVLKLELFWVRPDKSAQAGGDAINIGRDGIVGLIVAGATVVGKGFQAATGVANWMASIFDIMAGVLTVLGICLFLTGRGLVVHAAWARIVAGIAALGALLISYLTMTALRRGAALTLLPIGLSIYVLWVLIRRFN